MIYYGLFIMIYKPSKLIYSSVHIDRVYHFIWRLFFTNTFIYVYHFWRTPGDIRIKKSRFRSLGVERGILAAALRISHNNNAKYDKARMEAWWWVFFQFIWWLGAYRGTQRGRANEIYFQRILYESLCLLLFRLDGLFSMWTKTA